MPIPSTVQDVRINAAACELARCVHAMRLAAFDLPVKAWRHLDEGEKRMFVEYAHVLLLRLAPIAPIARPTLTLVETPEPDRCLRCSNLATTTHYPYCDDPSCYITRGA